MLIYMGSWLGSLRLCFTLLDYFVTAMRHPTNFSCNPIPHISQAMVFVFPDFKAQCLNYGQKKTIREGNVLICLLTAVLSGIYFKVIIGMEIAMKKWPFPTNNLRHLCVFETNLQTFVDTSFIASHIYFRSTTAK